MHALSYIRAMNTPEGIKAHNARLTREAPLGQSRAQEAPHNNVVRLLNALDAFELAYGSSPWLTAMSALPLSTLRELADKVYAVIDGEPGL